VLWCGVLCCHLGLNLLCCHSRLNLILLRSTAGWSTGICIVLLSQSQWAGGALCCQFGVVAYVVVLSIGVVSCIVLSTSCGIWYGAGYCKWDVAYGAVNNSLANGVLRTVLSHGVVAYPAGCERLGVAYCAVSTLCCSSLRSASGYSLNAKCQVGGVEIYKYPEQHILWPLCWAASNA
jgi:hypothetical protein